MFRVSFLLRREPSPPAGAGLKRRILLAAGALGVICACNTPSVPLPPPNLPALGFQPATQAGQVVLSGKPEQRHALARFYVYDRGNGDGVITTAGADGAFTSTPFTGAEGDFVQIYYDTPAGERSEDACVELRFNVPLLSTRCQ